MYREVFIKGYYRKNGIFVSPHIRKVMSGTLKTKVSRLYSYRTADKNQLAFDFSGKTTMKF